MLNNIYNLKDANCIEGLMTVDNPFIRQLAVLSSEKAKENKILSIDMGNVLSRSGEFILDIKKLPSLSGKYVTLLDEVSSYRAKSIGLAVEGDLIGDAFIENNKDILFVDYMLASSVCYVEVFGGNKVDKYLATKNRMLAGAICGKTEVETRKYLNYLTPYASMYENNQLGVLKINVNKKGKSITQPRGYLDLNKKVKIVPLFFLNMYLKQVMGLLEKGYVKFTYIKDNLTEREFVSTLNEGKMSQYYDSAIVDKMKRNHELKLSRGYVRLPEMGISKYDLSCVRSLNLSRITSMEVVDSFDTRFIDVDFSMILNSFYKSIQGCEDINLLVHIYTELVQSPPSDFDSAIVKSELISYIESQHIIGTTTLLRQLHLYMLRYPQVFKNYDGKSDEDYGFSNKSFSSLGLE